MYSQSNCHTHNTNCMYQRLAYVVHLHRLIIVVYSELDVLVKKRIFCYIASVFSNKCTRPSDTVAFDDRRSS